MQLRETSNHAPGTLKLNQSPIVLVQLTGTINCSWDKAKNAQVCENVGTPVCPVAGPNVAMPAGCIQFGSKKPADSPAT